MAGQRIQLGLRATSGQNRAHGGGTMSSAGQQRHTVQMPSCAVCGWQLGAYRFEVHIPAAGQWFAPQQGAVQVDQRAAARSVMACTRPGWALSSGVQSGIRMVGASWRSGVMMKVCLSTRLPS
jgi:hypothetical protein